MQDLGPKVQGHTYSLNERNPLYRHIFVSGLLTLPYIEGF